MTDWRHRLELKDLHDNFDSGTITPKDLGKEVAKRIRALVESNNPPILDTLKDEAGEIALDFEYEVDDVDTYDNILDRLYDWGDTTLPCSCRTPFSQIPKLCWINTF